MAASLKDSGARSVKGRPLLVRDLGDDSARLRVLVIGAIHGDELSSASLAFHWLSFALEGRQAQEAPLRARFVPVLNPDGVLAKPPRRVNASGVDLNRNFPTSAAGRAAPERGALEYWERRAGKDPRRWPGRSALSEPEAKFVDEQIRAFRPNVVVAIHAPFGLLDFDGPAPPPSKLGRLRLDQLGVYPGSLGNYSGIQKAIPVVTVELPSAWRTPPDSEMRQMWRDLQRWATEHTRAGPKPAK